MILPNGCKASEPKVFPKNWKDKDADISIDWYIDYRFYEPGKKPAQKRIKGMNDIKTLKQRQIITADALAALISDLKNGYNPNIRKTIHENIGEVNPNTLFYPALEYAKQKADFIPETKKEIDWVLRHTKPVAEILNYHILSIGDIRQKHIKTLLSKCRELKPTLTNNSYNVYRKYLYKLFVVLEEFEAVELNPVNKVKKLPIITKIRPSLSKEEERLINNYLQKNYPEFWRFLHIFYQSGCRIKEIMRLQMKDVYLSKQEFKITVFKGKKYREELKSINDEVLPLWKDLLQTAKPNDYIFSESLLPGATPIKAYQIGKRWYRLVKKPLAIEADFYSLKHSKITAVIDAKGIGAAATLASHKERSKGNNITKVYDLRGDERHRDELKKIKTPFGK